ncbi:MAG: hypothetical protein GQ574_06920 [Crocinitomix sp.]|nr:hypothetical protein [Crocinitomix sp.]
MHILILSLLLFSCGSPNSNQTEEVHSKNQTFETVNFAFQYPNNWREGALMEGLTAHVEESDTPDEFRDGILYLSTNFSVFKEISNEKSLDKTGDKYEEKILNSLVFSNGKIESREKIKFAGTDALEFFGSAQLQKWNVRWKIVILHYNGNYFEISTMSEVKRFEDMKTTIDPIFESFEFK